jgi:protoporphyrinogen oxidase
MQSLGGELLRGQKVVGCHYDEQDRKWTLTLRDREGQEELLQADDVVSSAPLRELADSITPRLPEPVLESAGRLKYRDFVTVAVMLPDRDLFRDNWIYIHDPSVKVGRIQNFKSWSPELVPDPNMCCYGLEYFCFEGDGLWASSDRDLIELAKRELEKIGLAKASEITDGCVVRQKKAYPVYDDEYASHVETLRKEFERHYPSLHLVGRNGMHKYNNQDHAMMTAMLCVENIIAKRTVYDLWQVNQDAEYHETGEASTDVAASGLRLVPMPVTSGSSGAK